MTLFRHFIIALFISLSLVSQVYSQNKLDYSRNFWNPTYHIQRLSYCSFGGKECGLPVANCYCKMMGYEKATKQIIDYNVGITNYLSTHAQCKGWSCNGFMLITCASSFRHHPPEKYYYRFQRFDFPRFGHYRVDWCYANGKGCGHRAAYSFCRRMGYSRDQSYKKEENIGATKAIGNRRLCFGKRCKGFSSITCYR